MHLNWSRLHHHMAPRSRTQSKMHLITRASCWTGGFVWSRACVYLAAGKGPGLLTGPAGYFIIPVHHGNSAVRSIFLVCWWGVVLAHHRPSQTSWCELSVDGAKWQDLYSHQSTESDNDLMYRPGGVLTLVSIWFQQWHLAEDQLSCA